MVDVDGVEHFLDDLQRPPDVANNPEVKSFTIFVGEVCTDLHSGLTLLFSNSPHMLETLCIPLLTMRLDAESDTTCLASTSTVFCTD